MEYDKSRLKNRLRITTSAKCKDGTMMYARLCSQMNSEQIEIYDTLGIGHQAGERGMRYMFRVETEEVAQVGLLLKFFDIE